MLRAFYVGKLGKWPRAAVAMSLRFKTSSAYRADGSVSRNRRSSGGVGGSSGIGSGLQPRERALEQAWANREDMKLAAALARKAKAAATVAEAKPAAALEAEAAAEASIARARAPALTAERQALENIVGTRLSKADKEKLFHWRRQLF